VCVCDVCVFRFVVGFLGWGVLVLVTKIFCFFCFFLVFFSYCPNNFWFIEHHTMDKVQKYASTYANTPSLETYRSDLVL
jgi:hypothetical protein